MSSTVSKRKRVRRACIPCHQRKRKCDAEYPCGMCNKYEYNCNYAADGEDTITSARGGTQTPPPVKLVGSGASSSTKSPSIEMGRSEASTTPAIISLFDERKFRYSGASAAMAFPHVLGVTLGSDDPPKMRSFAYNFGVRPEESSNAHGSLIELISGEELTLFSAVYFSTLGPINDYLDPEIYAQRCKAYFQSRGSVTVAFGAVAAGTAALGSFLSPDKHPRETELVRYAKAILEDPVSTRVLSIDHIIAWGLRTLYLRATTRPTNAWVASCTNMHLCEAMGLHDEENIKRMAAVDGAAAVGYDAERLRQIFWFSWAGHNMLSYEYDRSSVQFRAITCQTIKSMPGSVADQFVRIAQFIPTSDSPFRLECQPSIPREEFFERLRALDKLQVTHPFLVVTKADLAFCFYRRIYQLKMGISDEMIKLIIDSGNAAIVAAEQLAIQGLLFWNVIGSVFQYACVLLAMDAPIASAHIPAAFQGLQDLVKAVDTGLTRQAWSAAQNLLNLHLAKKRKELAQLEAIETSHPSLMSQPGSESNPAEPDLSWTIDWDQFLLEPYVSMLDFDFQP